MEPLNSSIEVGLRALILLNAAFPASFDIATLTALDHQLVRGTASDPGLHPPVPNPIGELGIKRTLLEDGLTIMVRSQLVNIHMTTAGVQYGAADGARAFVDLLESEHAVALKRRASHLLGQTGDAAPDNNISLTSALSNWPEQFWSERDGQYGPTGDRL